MPITYETTYSSIYGDEPDSAAANSELNRALILGSYSLESVVNMYVDGAQVASTATTMRLVDGSVTVERFNACRRTMQISLQGVEGDAVSNHLKNYGSLLGMEFEVLMEINGYLFSLGYFIPDEVEHAQDGITYAITVVGGDRSTLIATNARTTRYTIENGTPKNRAFQEYILDRYPTAQLVMESIEGTCQTLTFGIQDEPWQGAIDLAESFGCETYFDRFGRCVLAKVPDPKTQPVSFNYSDNDETKYPFITEAITRNINVREIYNGVIVQAEAPWLLFPVCGHKWDTDPTSETYYDPNNPGASPVGPHPMIVRDSKVGTQAAANLLAESKFNELVGQSEPVSFAAMNNPRLDAGQVIYAEATEVGLDGRVAIDNVEFPLTARGSMQVSGRRIA